MLTFYKLTLKKSWHWLYLLAITIKKKNNNNNNNNNNNDNNNNDDDDDVHGFKLLPLQRFLLNALLRKCNKLVV